jgi:ketose-bisphosphate aldolase
MKDLKYYLTKAKKEKWAVGQFNFCTLEQLRGIMAAAAGMKSPIILGTSEGEAGFLGIKEAVALVEILKVEYGVAAFLNLDHGKNLGLIKEAVDFGYSAVHFDGSSIGDIEKNIMYAQKTAIMAHKKGIMAEGEIDDIQKDKLTDAKEAEEFVRKTGVDSLAIALGNIHGFYKNVKLDFKRLKEIRSQTNAFLVLHGGSGISTEQVRKAVKLGISKVNVNTELRMAWKEGIKKGIKGKEVKPYKVLPEAEKAVQKKVEEKIRLFSSYNKV